MKFFTKPLLAVAVSAGLLLSGSQAFGYAGVAQLDNSMTETVQANPPAPMKLALHNGKPHGDYRAVHKFVHPLDPVIKDKAKLNSKVIKQPRVQKNRARKGLKVRYAK